MKKIKIGLRTKLLVIFVLATLVTAGVIANILIGIGKKALTDSVYREQREIARRVADRISIRLGAMKTILVGLTADRQFTNIRKDKTATFLKNKLLLPNEYIYQCVILDSQGKEIVNIEELKNKVTVHKKLADRSKRNEFMVPFKYGMSYIAAVYPKNSLPAIMVAVPVQKKNTLIAFSNLTYIWNLVAEAKNEMQEFLYVIDDKGNLVVYPEEKKMLSIQKQNKIPGHWIKLLNKSQKKKKNQEEEFVQYIDETGREMLALYHEITGLNWLVVTEITADKVYQPVNKMISQVIIWTTVCVILVILVVVWIMRYIINPLTTLIEGTKLVSKGDLDFEIRVNSNDEIGLLAENFNKMTESLLRLEKVKQDLTHMIVHDLKNPLTSILSGIELMLGQQLGPLTDPQKSVLSIADRGGKSLLILIEDMLDVAKMEEGKYQLQTEKLNLRETFKQVLDEISITAQNEDKKVYIEIEEKLPSVPGDKRLLQRVVTNLLVNAFKHTPSHKNIKFSIRHNDKEDNVVISVKDEGEGIPKEYQNKIFEKFVQAKRKEAKLSGSVGLGLTFCKMVVELHGGKIWVESELGKGSEFMFSLPLKTDDKRRTTND